MCFFLLNKAILTSNISVPLTYFVTYFIYNQITKNRILEGGILNQKKEVTSI